MKVRRRRQRLGAAPIRFVGARTRGHKLSPVENSRVCSQKTVESGKHVHYIDRE